MKNRGNSLATMGFLGAVLLIFTVADFLKPDRLFSEAENRILAGRPEFSWEALWNGDYTADYEEYVTDQFVNRDAWIGLKTLTDMALQKKELNGVYLGKDDYLIEVHDPADYPTEQEDKQIASLKKLAERWDAWVMLVPSADNILVNKLPTFAAYYNEKTFLEKVKKEVGTERCIDVYSVLAEHAEEEIYYRTDPHWTSLGAYYGMRAWERATGSAAAGYTPSHLASASADFLGTTAPSFLGTLHSRINIAVEPEEILYFPATEQRVLQVTYDFARKTGSLYEPSRLNTKNQYGFFLDDNHAVVEIDTDCRNNRTLFVLKDSFANCMIPLLVPHYEKIYMVDPRYYKGKLSELMEACEPTEGMDTLVLYNCIHFLEEFRYE